MAIFQYSMEHLDLVTVLFILQMHIIQVFLDHRNYSLPTQLSVLSTDGGQPFSFVFRIVY